MELTRERFAAARAFIEDNARPIDRRLFDFWFAGGDAAEVLAELAAYQNDDGGFGRAIEPDLRMPGSSPMATSVGLQYATAVGAETEEPVVAAAIDYLVAAYDRDGGYWPATSVAVNDAPHAPWWHLKAMAVPDEAAWANPSAEILGYLYHHAALVPEDLLARATARAWSNLAGEGSLERHPDAYYSVLCWQRAEPFLPAPLRAEVNRQLDVFFGASPPTAESLGHMRASWLASSPECALNRHAPDTVAAALDTEIGEQADDGGWWPAWSWGDGWFEEAWPTARREWAGKLTVDLLKILERYERIAGR